MDNTTPAPTIVMFANTAWYLYNFRLLLARRLRSRGYHVVLIAPHDDYVAKLRDEGFEVRTLEMNRRGLNPFGEALLLCRLARLLASVRPVSIFNFTIKCVVYGSLAARLSGTRSRINAVAGMGTIYSNKALKFRLIKPLVTALLKLSLLGKGSRLILQNQDDQQTFSRQGIMHPDAMILIRGSGVCGQRFKHPEQPPHRNSPRKVLFASRLLWAKGIGDFADLARQFSHHQDIRFLIAGSPDFGNPDSISPTDLEQWRNTDNIELLGHVDDMAVLLQEVDLIVLPSVYGEGVPRILVEGAASGIPLIAYDVAGSREIVQHGRNGFLVPPGDISNLKVRVTELLESEQLQASMGRESRKVFATEYDEATVNQRTIEVIESTLPRHALAGAEA